MKSKISTGIWFIFFGIIALLHNFDIIDFNFYALLRYWPLIIVSIGVNLIFQHKTYGTTVLVIINTLLCLFLAYVGFSATERFTWTGNIINNSTSVDTANIEQSIEVPFDDSLLHAKLEFNIGASSVKIENETPHLLFASSASKTLGFSLYERDKSSYELTALINNKSTNKSSKTNKVSLSLNTKPIWDLSFNIGAAKFNADLRNHHFSKMEINAGAAALDLILGLPSTKETIIEINAAASSSKITIPKDAACSLESSTILSNNKLEGFTKKNDLWQTDNYDTADKKYIIKLVGAANSLRINRD